MDIYCPICGEPWEFDTLHEEAQDRYGVDYYVPDSQGATYGDPWYKKTKNPNWNSENYDTVYQQVRREFQSKGCKALTHITDASYCKKREVPEDSPERDRVFNLTPEEAAGALYEILGDDMDGAAAMLEDMGY